jgi:aminomethyltransferase
MSELARLPLHRRHEALGARFAPFAGFEMPIRYGSIVEEHQAVRTQVGLFDVSHMGEVELTGPRALEVANDLVTNDVGRLVDGGALYTAMCHPHGGIVDDLIVYRLGPERVFICVNAANRQKDFAHIEQVVAGRCQVANRSDDYAQLAIQGPRAVEVVGAAAASDVTGIKPFTTAWAHIAGVPVLLSRTGYTGEDGFEVYWDASRAEPVFDALWEAGQRHGMKAIGLGARDTLRLEARYMLYGSDITDDTTPLEAGLGWVVKLEKGPFVGREALLAQKARGLERKLVGFLLEDRGVLRPHYPVLFQGQAVGELTSGGPSPTLGGSIGLGYVGSAAAGQPSLDVDIRGKACACRVTQKPFYKRSGG